MVFTNRSERAAKQRCRTIGQGTVRTCISSYLMNSYIDRCIYNTTIPIWEGDQVTCCIIRPCCYVNGIGCRNIEIWRPTYVQGLDRQRTQLNCITLADGSIIADLHWRD